MFELALKVLLGYLLGSVNGSLVIAGLSGSGDIRKEGSGNAGGTNALRTRGVWFALPVIAIDIGKGYLAAGVLPGLGWPGMQADPAIGAGWIALLCAAAAVVGHCYPVWFDFRGGKGAAPAIGVLLAIAPGVCLPGLLVWLLVLTTTGFVGLATITAAAALPVYVGVTALPEQLATWIFLLWLAAFIIYTHRSNIGRMLRHEENRMVGAMLLRRTR